MNNNPHKKPDPSAYGLSIVKIGIDEQEAILNDIGATKQERGVFRAVNSLQGISSGALNYMFGPSASVKRKPINQKLSNSCYRLELISLPTLTPLSPWCWFLVESGDENEN